MAEPLLVAIAVVVGVGFGGGCRVGGRTEQHVGVTLWCGFDSTALFFEFWRLAVDVLIVLLVGIRRTQQFDQLRGTCSHLCHACMHFGH